MKNTNELELSVVVPVYHNEGSLQELYTRIQSSVEKINITHWDITFVDDGSMDLSREILSQLKKEKNNVRVIELSRNFGSMAAIMAGLQYVKGSCIAVIAADLQDPPEMLSSMIERWRKGIKIILATRESREDPLFSKIFSFLFYRLFRLLVSKEMPPGGFDFFVLDQQVARLLVQYSESNASIPAAILSLGFSKDILPYHRSERKHGQSMWTMAKKIKYMYDMILSYSYIPLRVMVVIGCLGVIVAFSYAFFIIWYRFTHPEETPGWASLMVVTLFFSSVILISIGIVGEYVWRSFDAARKRPLFIVDTCSEPTPQINKQNTYE
jgi:glycosyltransferase involved in cell wall biosynthesis